MSNRAWMPLHIVDYLADTGHLTVTEHGAYMLLIMAYWQRGGLPEDERMIARMARMTPDQWAESRDVLADLFEDGWRHKRIDAELVKADEIIEKRKNAASAMHKRRKTDAHAVQVQSTCSDTRVPPLTSNQEKEDANASSKKRGTRLADDWCLSRPDYDWSVDQGFAEHVIGREMAKFLDYWRAQPGQKGVKLDWSATWRNWMRNVQARAASPPQRGQSQHRNIIAIAEKVAADERAENKISHGHVEFLPAIGGRS